MIIIELGGWNLLEAVGIIVQTPITPGSEGYDVLMLFAELGVIFLLFSVGLESKVSDLFKVGKSAVYVALLGIAVPFILGLIFMSLTGGNLMASLFIATVLITTSAGVAAQMLKDLDMCNAIEGKIILGAAVISAGLARDCTRFSGGRYADLEKPAAKYLAYPGYCSPR